jgi:PAS domain S-box-containing protein
MTRPSRRKAPAERLGRASRHRGREQAGSAELRLRVEHAVTLALANSSGIAEATTGVLEGIRDAYGWDWAALWVVDRDAQVLVCREIRSTSRLDVRAFERASRETPLARAVGLPGRVWDTGTPAWISDVQDDANFPRQIAARKGGLHGAFGLPIPCDGEVIAVIECLTGEIRQPQSLLLATLESIGRLLGQFIERKRAEEGARRHQAHLAAIIEVSLDCIVSMDHEGRVTAWNPAAEQTFGYLREEALGREMAELIIPEPFRTRHRDGLRRYLATGKEAVFNRRLELKGRRADGSEFPVELTVTRVPGEGPPLFIGFLRDISDRKAAQEELERGRALFKSIAETTPDILSLYDVRTNTPVYANREAAAVLGYSAEEIIALGQQARGKLVHPDDLPQIMKVIAGFDHLADGETAEYEFRALHKNGEYRWMLGRSVVFTRLADGQPQQVLSLTQDVTRRKHWEERLRESEERLRLGLDAGNTGTWDWDIAANQVVWSDRVYEFHDVARGEFGGRVEDFQKLLHPEDAQRVGAAIRHCLETGERYEIEFRVCTPAGRVKWLSTTGEVYYDEGRRPIRMMGATTDITARKEAQLERDMLLGSERTARSEAERANRLKDEFLATVSHELRTPLNAILGYAQLLRLRPIAADVAQGLEVIERNARIQAEIIADLLDMSRIISGKLRLDVQPVDLPQVIEAALETVRPAAQARDIRLVKTLDTLAGPVRGDANRLQQVVWNLLTNAVKFTPKGGRVHIVLSRVNSHVEIRVSDTGSGIAADFLPYVFDKFRQSDASASRKHGGLGLGLALVKSLVEMHGGSVRVNSPGEGQGATFVVELPVSAVQLVNEAGRQHPGATSPGAPSISYERLELKGVTVLAVDDEQDSRVLIQRILEEHGARVLTATSAAEALDILGREQIDLLLSDIGMPAMDGYELMRRVRALGPGANGDVPAAALTAFARSEDRTRALIAGYHTHIAKPVEPLELAAAVASLARRRH